MNNSVWQKCPVCNGTKVVDNYPHPFSVPIGTKQCSVCNGYGVLSILTGLPPTMTAITSSPTASILDQPINNFPCNKKEHDWIYFTDNFNSWQKCKKCCKIK